MTAQVARDMADGCKVAEMPVKPEPRGREPYQTKCGEKWKRKIRRIKRNMTSANKQVGEKKLKGEVIEEEMWRRIKERADIDGIETPRIGDGEEKWTAWRAENLQKITEYRRAKRNEELKKMRKYKSNQATERGQRKSR